MDTNALLALFRVKVTIFGPGVSGSISSPHTSHITSLSEHVPTLQLSVKVICSDYVLTDKALSMPLLLSQPHTMYIPGTASLRRDVDPSKMPQLAVQPVDEQSENDFSIPHINLSYESSDSEGSVRKLMYRIRPKWRDTPNELEFTKFTDGITNTVSVLLFHGMSPD